MYQPCLVNPGANGTAPPVRCLTEHLQVGAVIVSPTRELAKQIFDVAAPYLADVCVAPPMLLVGGSDPRGDVDALRERGANVLVGTPGRLHDVMERTEGFLHFKGLELLILDEADRLLGMGFQRCVSRPLRVHTRPAGSVCVVVGWPWRRNVAM